MKRLIIFLTIPLLFTTCEKYEDRTYFKTEGVGYVYYEDTKKPVQYAIIHVNYNFKNRGYATVQPDYDSFTADANGYFCIKFLKRTKKENVVGYSIIAKDSIYSNDVYMRNWFINISPSEIAGQNILNLDTLWVIQKTR